MATPDLFTTEASFRDEHLHATDFVGVREQKIRAVPENLPIAGFAYRGIKPLLDLLLVFLALPVLLPVGLLIASIIRITSSGPSFYHHRRIGQFEEPFFAWKFRTMYENSDDLLERHLAADAEARREWSDTHKLRNDPRVTPIGKFLRKTSLDEIPQVINVLAGEMSLVGPRPIVEMEKAKYGMYMKPFSYAMPGITGLWQVSGRCDVSYPERVKLDIRYVNEWSLWMEFKIICKTFFVMIHREGAY